MINLYDLDLLRDGQPWFLYKRVPTTTPTGYCFFPLEYGFWYLLRKVNVKFAETNAAKTVFANSLNVEAILRGTNKIPQNEPIPFNLLSSPGSAGVSPSVSGQQQTATGVKNSKLLNTLYPFRDNIELYVTGQGGASLPAFIDIVCIGYLIPEKSFYMWQGGKDG